MGLFDFFKKKAPQPQQAETEDFNPLDMNSVIGYIKAQKPSASEQEVADIISKLAEPEEDQDHLTTDGDLPWGWISVHKKEIQKYETQYNKAWSEWFNKRSASPREHMIALESFVECMAKLKKQLEKRGECYNYWRDTLFTDDFLDRWSKELDSIKENIEILQQEFEEKQAFEANVLPTLEKELLKIIKEQPGILQKDIYKLFNPVAKSYISETLYQAGKSGKIIREKSGNTYKLFPKSRIIQFIK